MSKQNKSGNNLEELQEKLREIKDQEGIVGYILRSQDSASIDLKDPTRIVDYAVMSTTAFEAGEDISTLFEIGGVDTMILEGEDAKLLSSTVNKHRLSIFMEKSVDHNKLCKELNLA
ncbi:MAG: roadblock/LC7 domain-containing protein [Candidatus Bathyarchaeota archaeon]|nr:MAG: roadblock/LC7 domain-containing protein [Candidatus Bathyarchaeota archaeon]